MKALMILFLSAVPLSAFSNINPNFAQHKNQLQQVLNEKTQSLQLCRSDCRSTYPYYTAMECDSQVCSSQKTAYNQAKSKLSQIAQSQNVVANKQSALNRMKSEWDSCQSRCLNKPNNRDSAEHCRNVVCQAYKKSYESHQASAQRMDESLKQVEKDSEKKPLSGGEAVVNQVREKRDKVGLLGFVAAGSGAFLMAKGFKCSSQCGATGGGGCCAQAPMYYGMGGLALLQAGQMFNKRGSLNQTCQDLSTNGVCNPNPPAGGGNPDDLAPPNPLPPGCESNPSLCDPSAYQLTPSAPCPPGDSACFNSKNLPGSGNPLWKGPGALTGASPLAEVIDKMKPKGGWPDGKHPLEDNEEFDYNSLSAEQKSQLNKAMKGFNQKKQQYMAENGLLGGSSDDSKKGEGDLLAENLEDELDLGSGFSNVKDPAGSLTGSSANKRSRRTKRSGNREPSSIEKLKEMLKKVSGEDSGANDLSKMSVSIGNDNVGVREDNIFLMVHRMNRKLDEQQRRFIIDF